jgi:hypothetical protein
MCPTQPPHATCLARLSLTAVTAHALLPAIPHRGHSLLALPTQPLHSTHGRTADGRSSHLAPRTPWHATRGPAGTRRSAMWARPSYSERMRLLRKSGQTWRLLWRPCVWVWVWVWGVELRASIYPVNTIRTCCHDLPNARGRRHWNSRRPDLSIPRVSAIRHISDRICDFLIPTNPCHYGWTPWAAAAPPEPPPHRPPQSDFKCSLPSARGTPLKSPAFSWEPSDAPRAAEENLKPITMLRTVRTGHGRFPRAFRPSRLRFIRMRPIAHSPYVKCPYV